MSSKNVAIIGAGPGGLVAAKTLLHSEDGGTFKVTIFEKSDRIGGIWSVTKAKQDGIIPLDMPTNLSQFAVSFSDLAWTSLDFNGRRANIHPKAWQVNQYLEEYARRYIPPHSVKLGTEVTGIEQDASRGWRIKSTSRSGREEERHFDFCILASGFYAKAQPLRCELHGFGIEAAPVKIVHSSLYRGLKDILPDSPGSGKKLLVIGGANSGGEAAAALAFDLSNSIYSPGGKTLDYEIIHILPKPAYGIPLFVPSADTPGSFVPLDVRFYDLSKRSDHPVSLKVGRHTDDSKKMLHGMIQAMLGTDSYENGLQKPLNKHEGNLLVPKAAIQDNWASYVRSGSIKLQIGRVQSLHSNGSNSSLSVIIQTTTETMTTIDDIAGIVYATGYTSEPALRILPENILQALSFDSDCPRLPILLPEDSLASSSAVPNLAFVGLYEGPYWGVLEMQARQLTARWSGSSSPTHSANTISSEQTHSERTQTRLESLQDMRAALKEAPHLVPQYIFSDYLAIMEESARDLGLTRNNGIWHENQGPITPSRYLDTGSNKSEADKTIANLQDLLNASSSQARFVPRCVFRGLQGRWKVQRQLKSARPEYPTGTFDGEAWFHPRSPAQAPISSSSSSSTKPPKVFDKEYLYLETGTLKTDTGFTFPAYKNYAWRFSEEPEEVSVWFVKGDDEGRAVDYLYHGLEFVVGNAENGKNATVNPIVREDGKILWKAKGDHLCERDMYWTEYGFVFDGVAVERFEVVHRVKGPSKDYVSTTVYTRPQNEVASWS